MQVHGVDKVLLILYHELLVRTIYVVLVFEILVRGRVSMSLLSSTLATAVGTTTAVGANAPISMQKETCHPTYGRISAWNCGVLRTYPTKAYTSSK